MVSKVYNDMQVILENTTEELRNLVPDKLKEFMREHMDPDYQSTISKEIPFSRQELSEETRGFLAGIFTYWAEDPKERCRMAEKIRNTAGSPLW